MCCKLFNLLTFWLILQNVALNYATNSKKDISNNHSKQLPQPNLLIEIDSKMLNGTTPVAITSAPWQISVRLKAYDDKQYGYGHMCGGSVISQRAIVTAARCAVRSDAKSLAYREPNKFTIVMGTVYLYEIAPLTQRFDVLRIVPHPKFKLNPLQNDIALFFLDGQIPIDYPTIAPIPLNNLALTPNQICTVTGWGITENGITSPILLGLTVSIVNPSFCHHSNGVNLTGGSIICAGHTAAGDGAITACQGDFGGPLVCNNTLAGIVSWGRGCSKSGSYPGVYTNVSMYRNWIVRILNSTLDSARNEDEYFAANSVVEQQHLQLAWGILCSMLIVLNWSRRCGA